MWLFAVIFPLELILPEDVICPFVIIFPLALPAIAVLGILSIIWRWNDLILPMIAVSTTKAAYTIQLCLLDFNGEYLAREHYALAMTVVSLIPTTLVFVFLQKYITTGIASTGMK